MNLPLTQDFSLSVIMSRLSSSSSDKKMSTDGTRIIADKLCSLLCPPLLPESTLPRLITSTWEAAKPFKSGISSVQNNNALGENPVIPLFPFLRTSSGTYLSNEGISGSSYKESQTQQEEVISRLRDGFSKTTVILLESLENSNKLSAHIMKLLYTIFFMQHHQFSNYLCDMVKKHLTCLTRRRVLTRPNLTSPFEVRMVENRIRLHKDEIWNILTCDSSPKTSYSTLSALSRAYNASNKGKNNNTMCIVHRNCVSTSFVTCCKDGTISLWNFSDPFSLASLLSPRIPTSFSTQEPSPISTFFSRHVSLRTTHSVLCAALSPSGKYCVTCGNDSLVNVWNVRPVNESSSSASNTTNEYMKGLICQIKAHDDASAFVGIREETEFHSEPNTPAYTILHICSPGHDGRIQELLVLIPETTVTRTSGIASQTFDVVMTSSALSIFSNPFYFPTSDPELQTEQGHGDAVRDLNSLSFNVQVRVLARIDLSPRKISDAAILPSGRLVLSIGDLATDIKILPPCIAAVGGYLPIEPPPIMLNCPSSLFPVRPTSSQANDESEDIKKMRMSDVPGQSIFRNATWRKEGEKPQVWSVCEWVKQQPTFLCRAILTPASHATCLLPYNDDNNSEGDTTIEGNDNMNDIDRRVERNNTNSHACDSRFYTSMTNHSRLMACRMHLFSASPGERITSIRTSSLTEDIVVCCAARLDSRIKVVHAPECLASSFLSLTRRKLESMTRQHNSELCLCCYQSTIKAAATSSKQNSMANNIINGYLGSNTSNSTNINLRDPMFTNNQFAPSVAMLTACHNNINYNTELPKILSKSMLLIQHRGVVTDSCEGINHQRFILRPGFIGPFEQFIACGDEKGGRILIWGRKSNTLFCNLSHALICEEENESVLESHIENWSENWWVRMHSEECLSRGGILSPSKTITNLNSSAEDSCQSEERNISYNTSSLYNKCKCVLVREYNQISWSFQPGISEISRAAEPDMSSVQSLLTSINQKNIDHSLRKKCMLNINCSSYLDVDSIHDFNRRSEIQSPLIAPLLRQNFEANPHNKDSQKNSNNQIETSKPILILSGHSGIVNAVASPRLLQSVGVMLLSVSDDQTLRVWSIID